MVECAGLEIQYTFMRIEGSNPSLSAKDCIRKFKESPRDFVNYAGFLYFRLGQLPLLLSMIRVITTKKPAESGRVASRTA